MLYWNPYSCVYAECNIIIMLLSSEYETIKFYAEGEDDLVPKFVDGHGELTCIEGMYD